MIAPIRLLRSIESGVLPPNHILMYSPMSGSDALPFGNSSGPSYGSVTSWEADKTYSGFNDANINELNWVDKIGALLWKETNGTTLKANNAGLIQE